MREQDALDAWYSWVHDKPIDQGDGPERRAFLAGYGVREAEFVRMENAWRDEVEKVRRGEKS